MRCVYCPQDRAHPYFSLQKNFTAQEVIVKSRVYQRSKRQLAMMEELRDIFETEENARSEISDPSGTCTYTPKRGEQKKADPFLERP